MCRYLSTSFQNWDQLEYTQPIVSTEQRSCLHKDMLFLGLMLLEVLNLDNNSIKAHLSP